jgi:hypothetical protein
MVVRFDIVPTPSDFDTLIAIQACHDTPTSKRLATITPYTFPHH